LLLSGSHQQISLKCINEHNNRKTTLDIIKIIVNKRIIAKVKRTIKSHWISIR